MKEFPNGLTSWVQTHYEIVESITLHINNILEDPEMESKDDPIQKTRYQYGTSGLYNLAEEWTYEFETIHKGVQWGVEKEYFEEIETFFQNKIRN